MHANEVENARFNMIEQQIRPCEVIDERVLEALKNVPREHFVPEQYVGLAFADIHVPLAAETVMMKPVQEGVMLQALDVQPGEKVLEVGTGSGFITACLAELGGDVTSYEIDPELSAQAQKNLQQAGKGESTLVVGDVFAADLPANSFDVIAVTGSCPKDSEALEQLLKSGGRMFIIKGEEPAMCATLISRESDGQLTRVGLCETVLPALHNAPKPEKFSF